jgi:hypothetical protein
LEPTLQSTGKAFDFTNFAFDMCKVICEIASSGSNFTASAAKVTFEYGECAHPLNDKSKTIEYSVFILPNALDQTWPQLARGVRSTTRDSCGHCL